MDIHVILTFLPAILLGIACLALLQRRIDMKRSAKNSRELADAKERGSHQARLQHPEIDLSQCIGCGLCVSACPEDGVLELIHGQAAVVHGARCVGHGRCAVACPTNGIALTFGDLSDRRDLPILSNEFESIRTPGLFLAGEVTGFALVRTAIAQGTAVAEAAFNRIRSLTSPAPNSEVLDLIVVGAGPGGLACALRAKELGMSLVVLEQEDQLGGTVASYPRRKMVMTQPVELPLFGKLPKLTYLKEELVDIWKRAAEDHSLPIRTGHRLVDVARESEYLFHVETSQGTTSARAVCLALGRRGTPRKLGVPGEDRTHVAYSLLDAESYRDQKIIVVGGGDSAIEAAVGLSQQEGNQVTLSYRKKAFFRLKARNDTALSKAVSSNRLNVVYESDVLSIEDAHIELKINDADSSQTVLLPIDHVFIFAGGIPPFEVLERAGVSFDPADRPQTIETRERGTGLLVVLSLAFLSTLGMAAWAALHWDYYGLNVNARAAASWHELLRPTGPVGLTFGLSACFLFLWNLTYLLRRSIRWGGWLPGSLRLWMSSHIFTGLFALLCVLMHAGFSIKNAAGGHALAGLALVVVTGSIGRYLYAFVPRAANGAEADLDQVRARLASISSEWDEQGRGFGESVRAQIDELASAARWQPGILARIGILIKGQFRLRKGLRVLEAEARAQGVPASEVRGMIALARRSYRLTLQITHYEEVRAVLSSWRYFHRWLAVLMILLAGIHIVTAVRYAAIDWSAITRLPEVLR